MTLYKSTLYLVMIALVFTMLPMAVYSASYNRITKVVTVGQGEVLEGQSLTSVVIELKDNLDIEDTFYLLLEGAEWAVGAGTNEIAGLIQGMAQTDIMPSLEIKKLSTKELQIRVKEAVIVQGASISIPLAAKIIGDAATVTINNNNTAVSPGTYAFAFAMDYRGKVAAGEVKTATGNAAMAEIIIEEPYSLAFHKAILNGKKRTIQMVLNTNDYEFSLDLPSLGVPNLQGIKGFDTLSGDIQNLRKIDAQTLELTLPDLSQKKHTGGFVLSGIGLKTTHNSPAQGKVTATVQGDLIYSKTMNVLEVIDYGISLTAPTKVEWTAGRSKAVAFTLEEKVHQSLIRERQTDFIFTNKSRVRLNQQGLVEVVLNGEKVSYYPIYQDGVPAGFQVPMLPGTAMKYNFELMLDVPAQVKGLVEVVAEGRSLINALSAPLLEILPSAEITIAPMYLRVGLKDQVGGKITITEMSKGAIRQDADLFIQIEPSQVLFTKPPVVQITSGDIRLGTPAIVEGGIKIPVIRTSNTASTIEIKDFIVTVNQMVAEGTYFAQVGGSALSDFAAPTSIDALLEGPFMMISKEGAPVSKDQVTFRIGQFTYTTLGQNKIMDAAPYIKNGRTMLPIKYVALALGISEGNVLWNPEKQTVTVIGDQLIVLQIGSITMKIDGQLQQMSAPPEITSSRTFVPVAEITRALGVETKWDEALKQVSFN